ncbi:MAG: ABC transporter ATP-binding protein [Anaerolineae bacterium]|nr:ABC transporter ATP-binding protein [Anaerolineae bacterium]
MKSLARLFRLLKPYTAQIIIALVVLCGQVAADLIIPRLTQQAIDLGIARSDLSMVWRTAITMLGAAVLSSAMAVANTLLSVRVAQNFGADLRRAIMQSVQSWSFGNLDRIRTGQLIVRTTSDVNMVQIICMLSLRILTRMPLLMIGSVIMLIRTSPAMASIILVLLPALVGAMAILATKARPLFTSVQQRLDRLNNVLQENLAGVRVVKAFVRTEHENARFEAANLDLTNQSIHVYQMLSVLMPLLTVILNLGVVAAIWFGGKHVIEGTMSLGSLVAAINYLMSSLFPVLLLGGLIGPLAAAEASAGRILEVLNEEPSIPENDDAVSLPEGTAGHVALEHVSFSYDGDGGDPVLCDVNLEARPGERVAILGETGSGKSSLVNLIPRFYDVTAGRVTIDGVDVRDMRLDELRTQIGIALQETVLFTGTIRDNIRYGRPDATDEQVVAAAKVAQAHDFISAFPKGYDTMVGQRGVNLSGGQKQRIAIARALLVRPRVLILDDSTSAVDVDTEARLEEALREAMRDTTAIVIAQRISTALTADRIVVLEKGRVAAMGTHDELMVSSPIYQEIYASQLGNGGARHGHTA